MKRILPVIFLLPSVAAAEDGMHGFYGDYSMTRDSSGTAWQPDSTPMEGSDWASGGWTGMVHGYADLVYDHQGGTLLYQYPVGIDSIGQSTAPTAVSGTNIDSGVVPFLTQPIYIDYTDHTMSFYGPTS